MKRIKLLDCTLRDGGSLNQWKFEEDNIIKIIQNLNDSNIDIIEIGFLQNNAIPSMDNTISQNTDSFDELLEKIQNKNFTAFAMINIAKYDVSELKNKEETLIDGIRLMFKKSESDEAMKYAEIIKEKGYKLSLNPVSITTYSENDIKILTDAANKLAPDIVYIVDTYGLLNSIETIEYYNYFNNLLNKNIKIGYHSHNNLQLAFSNSVDIINKTQEREIIIDCSLYGMGKRAGNTHTELITSYLNNYYGCDYNIINILKIIEEIIMPLNKQYEWGFSLIHYIAAINKCHSDYVSYFYLKKNIPFYKINSILSYIPKEKKLIFDKDIAEQMLSNII